MELDLKLLLDENKCNKIIHDIRYLTEVTRVLQVEIIDKELHRMKLTSDDDQLTRAPHEKLLVARPIGDEASMSLIVTQFLSWFKNRILTAMTSKVKQFFSGIGLFSWIWKILLLVGVFILTAKNLFPV